MASRKSKEEPVVRRSETKNVFADLGLPNADELFTKAKLASAIHEMIDERGLTQAKAAQLMHIDQPKVSKILSGSFHSLTTEWLLQRLLLLGSDIEIVIHKPKAVPAREGSLTVAMM